MFPSVTRTRVLKKLQFRLKYDAAYVVTIQTKVRPFD